MDEDIYEEAESLHFKVMNLEDYAEDRVPRDVWEKMRDAAEALGDAIGKMQGLE